MPKLTILQKKAAQLRDAASAIDHAMRQFQFAAADIEAGHQLSPGMRTYLLKYGLDTLSGVWVSESVAAVRKLIEKA